MTRTRLFLLGIAAAIIAAVCIRLGVWQLERLGERRADNARAAAGLMGAPIAIEAVNADSTRSRAQRVDVRGSFDFDHEIALTSRSRDGAPGVNILTPLRVTGRDTAIIVNRGWVYSPDGATIDLALWREPVEASGTAYVSWLHVAMSGESGSESAIPAADPLSSTRVAPSAAVSRRVARLERTAIARLLPYPIAPYQLVLIDQTLIGGARGTGYGDANPSPFGTAVADSMRPVRIPLPALDEGPHKSYAAQWFAFAAIAIVGTGVVMRSEWPRRGRRAPL